MSPMRFRAGAVCPVRFPSDMCAALGGFATNTAFHNAFAVDEGFACAGCLVVAGAGFAWHFLAGGGFYPHDGCAAAAAVACH